MMPPRNAMSVPERIGAWMLASAEVRVKRGSTWITRRAAPLRLDHEAEGDRMVLRHVGAHDDDAVGVRQVPQRHASPRRVRMSSPDWVPMRSVRCGPGSRC